MFLLVPAYPGCPGETAVKWLLLLLLLLLAKLGKPEVGYKVIVCTRVA